MEEKLLFAVHEGTVGSRRAGIIMEGHCLPIACSHSDWAENPFHSPFSEYGFSACWHSVSDVEEFFLNCLEMGEGIECGPGSEERPSGLYVYEVDYELNKVDFDEDDDSWSWLIGGNLRRPTDKELEPLARGRAPWGGVVL